MPFDKDGLYVETTAERINHCRRLIHLHSICYYRFDINLVDDSKYDAWAKELQQLQMKYPEISKDVPYLYEFFKDFDGSVTGFNLPMNDIRMIKNVLFVVNRSYSHLMTEEMQDLYERIGS